MSEFTGFDFVVPLNFVFIYFSAFFALLGSIIFDISCPNIIRQHKSYPNFFVHSQALGVDILSKYAEVAERKDDALVSVVRKITESQGIEFQESADAALRSYMSEITKTNFLYNTEEVWRDENRSSIYARSACLVMYLISTGLGLYITLFDAPSLVLNSLQF